MLPKPIWHEKGKVLIIDQTKLPMETIVKEIKTPQEMWGAIQHLEVRGAPAIGLAGAFGIYLGVKAWSANHKTPGLEFLSSVEDIGNYLETSRPTAVNLHWAIERMKGKAEELYKNFIEEDKEISYLTSGMLVEAEKMLEEDIVACHTIGELGAEILESIPNFKAFLTHCNAGALATSMYGTALAPAYVMKERGREVQVYSDETRPLLQGSRLTAWELSQSGIPVTTICDSMAGVVMKNKLVQAVITGADRIAKNGDTANKIGTYSVAILAREHGIPFYIAAPISTIDFDIETGDEIPIEERKESEVRQFGEKQMTPNEASVFNPAFDVTPYHYITGIITELGVAYPPFAESLEALRRRKPQRVQEHTLQELKEKVLKTAKTMASAGLVSATFGNLSLLHREKELVAITPSGVFYDDMKASDICITDLNGKQLIENNRKPSSELVMHLAVYKKRQDISAIVHTHSVYATTAASMGEEIPPVVAEMGAVALGNVGVAPFALPGSEELAQKTVKALGENFGCLLANHGVVACGSDLDRAYMVGAIIEEGAKIYYLQKQAGKVSLVPKEAYRKVFEGMQSYGRQ